jgi:hypothetical protein
MQKISLLATIALIAGGAHAQMSAPVASPASPSNAAVKSSTVSTTSTVAKGANSFTEGQARSRISDAGYTRISHLKKDSDGLWQAKAMKDGQPVAVALDYKGNITAQ